MLSTFSGTLSTFSLKLTNIFPYPTFPIIAQEHDILSLLFCPGLDCLKEMRAKTSVQGAASMVAFNMSMGCNEGLR